jgi:hypothetical protein
MWFVYTRRGHDPYWAQPIVGRGLRGYLEVLIGAPIGAAMIVGTVALLFGGGFLMPALIAAAVAFGLVLAIGLVVVAFQLWPLLIVGALVVWAWHHWL